jgi:RNA polymerase sigma-70 factor (ECF subfamily)
VDADLPLVRAASAGDTEAFGELVRRYQAQVVNLARALAMRADAEDLAQETFIRAYRGIGRFRGESSFKTWLYRVALNVIRSHAAERSRWAPLRGSTLDVRPGESPAMAAPGAGIEERLLRRDAIDRALAALPLDLRSAVVLRDVQGLEYKEIAALLAVPIGTVESRIFRARQLLKPRLAGLLGRTSEARSEGGGRDDVR